MSKKRKPKMEFRYCKMPEGSPILALLGQKWTQSYGREIDYLHFHNYLEIGFCYEGQGEIVLGEQPMRFKGNQFSVIPKNYPHTTNSDPGTVSQWEYMFIDVENFLREQNGGGLYPENRAYDSANQFPRCSANGKRIAENSGSDPAASGYHARDEGVLHGGSERNPAGSFDQSCQGK